MAASVAWLATRGIADQCIGRLAVAKTRYTEMGATGDSGGTRRFNRIVVSIGHQRIFNAAFDELCLHVGEFAGVYGRGFCLAAARGVGRAPMRYWRCIRGLWRRCWICFI